jgi:hypothetical protein
MFLEHQYETTEQNAPNVTTTTLDAVNITERNILFYV